MLRSLIMEKLEWFQMEKSKRVEYLEEKLDNLTNANNLHTKKTIEKQIFEILNWEQKHDK